MLYAFFLLFVMLDLKLFLFAFLVAAVECYILQYNERSDNDQIIIIIIIRMTPSLNSIAKHWEKVVAFSFDIGFHNIGFQFSKKPRKPELRV